MSSNYWLLVISPENFRITLDQGFNVQGFPTSQRRKAERMEVGDRLLFYINRARLFAVTTTITSTYFEEHSRLWTSHDARETYPYRVLIEPTVVLEEDDYLNAYQIGPRMEYIKKWVPEMWPLALQGDLHILSRRDFSMIEDEMKKLVSAKAKR